LLVLALRFENDVFLALLQCYSRVSNAGICIDADQKRAPLAPLRALRCDNVPAETAMPIRLLDRTPFLGCGGVSYRERVSLAFGSCVVSPAVNFFETVVGNNDLRS
jgi:hypothetical protein